MTREEAYNRIDAIIAKYEIDDEYVTITSDKDYDALRMARNSLEQEPSAEKTVAQERYEDLCEYFGDAKDILENREDFKAWLDRVRWHIRKAEELSAENDDLRDQLAMRDRFQKQQPCEDAISRQAVLEAFQMFREYESNRSNKEWVDRIEVVVNQLPPVNPQPKTGWIPVSERLPEEKRGVLVWCPEYKNIYCAYLEDREWWIFGAFAQIAPNEVKAWMPLPEVYRAEGSGE